MAELDDHDDRAEFALEASDDEAGDPAVAFDTLRQTVESLAGDLTREMTTIRKGVEMALAEFDRQGVPADYKPELAQLVQQLMHVGERLQSVEQSPILRQGPEHYARALERTGESLVRTAAQHLERQAADLERAGRNLAVHVAGARERSRQNWWLAVAILGGLLAGVLFTLFLPAMLPFSAAPRVASVVMGDTPWRAGMALMAFESQDSWNRIAKADQLFEANKEAVTACREAAAKATEDQRCAITVPAPRQ
jgi:hypothetical protein